MRRFLAVFAAVLAVAAGSTALAHQGTFNSAVTISLQTGARDSFSGFVRSGFELCRRPGRLVKLYNVNPGSTGTRVYKVRTNARSRWRVTLRGRATPGRWFAVVPSARQILPPLHDHRCRGDRSRTIEISGGGGGHDG